MPDVKSMIQGGIEKGEPVQFSPTVRLVCHATGDFFRAEVTGGEQPEGFQWNESEGLAWWEGATMEEAVEAVEAALSGVSLREAGLQWVVVTKPYDKVSDAPANIQELEGAKLSLEQVNWIANMADGLKGKKGIDNPWAVAVGQFKRVFKKEGDKWVRPKPEKEEKEAWADVLDLWPDSGVVSPVLVEEEGNDLQATLDSIRGAFYKQLGDPDQAPPRGLWVDKIYPGYVIVQDGPEFYRVDYVKSDGLLAQAGDIRFAPRDEWVKGDMVFAQVVPTVMVEEAALPWVKMATAVMKAAVLRQRESVTVWCENEKRYYLALVSAAVPDDEGQLVTKEGADFSIALAQRFDYHSGLYVRHIVPETLIGRCLMEKRVGPYWLEFGVFYDTPLADLTFERLVQDKEGKWRLSIGFLTTLDQQRESRYTRLLKYDCSITDRPALRSTAMLAIGGTNMEKWMKLLEYLNPQDEAEGAKYREMLGELFAEAKELDVTAVMRAAEDLAALKAAIAGLEDEALKKRMLAAMGEPKAPFPPKEEKEVDEAALLAKLKDLVEAAPAESVVEPDPLVEIRDALTGLGSRLDALEQRDVVKEIKALLERPPVPAPPVTAAPVVPGAEQLVQQLERQLDPGAGPRHPLAGFAYGPGATEGG